MSGAQGGVRMEELRAKEAVRHEGWAGGWGSALIEAGEEEEEEGRKRERHERWAA